MLTDRAPSDDEWKALTEAPLLVTLALFAVGEHGPISAVKEAAASARTIAHPPAGGPADALVAEIAEEARSKEARHNASQHQVSNLEQVVEACLADLGSAATALRKLPNDEAAQVGGWFLGPALGYRAFSFHLTCTLFGCLVPASPGEVWIWMSYNFVMFAALPYFFFRRRYSAVQLNLKSAAPRADFVLIVTILLIESAYQVAAFPGILKLSPHALALAVPLSFLVFFLGTVLPTLVLIYAILLPRYLKLT